MNPQHTEDEQRLRHALRDEARRGAPSPLGVDAVTSRARRIRRRRTTLAALSTAAVVALAVPLGLAITDTTGSPDEPPVAGEPVELPERLLELDLLVDAEPGGDAPSLPYLQGRTIVPPTGDEVEVPGEGTPTSLARLGDQWLVLMDKGDGNYTVDAVDADGRLLRTAPAQSAPMVSEDGTVAAYVARSGDVHGLTADGTMMFMATADEVGPGAMIAAVQGSGDCQQAPGCTVTVNAGEGGVRVLTPDGEVDATSAFMSVDDVTGTRVLGTVSVADDGSCSALRDDSGERWRTCENSFGRLSPDGALAFGYPAYTDGMGPKSVSVVDMVDGRERVRFADDGRTDTHVRDVVWESDTALLMTVWDGEDRSWSILRAGIDGSLEEVEAGLRGDAMDPPVHLLDR